MRSICSSMIFFVKITPYYCLKALCLFFCEVFLLLSFISAYVVLQHYHFAPYSFLSFFIFFVTLWALYSTNIVLFSDFSVLIAVFFYDLVFGVITGFYTSMLLFYFLYLRGRIYCYIMDNISEIYFFLAYLCLMYTIAFLIQTMVISMQHSFLLWRL